jgi:hypothetical protein
MESEARDYRRDYEYASQLTEAEQQWMERAKQRLFNRIQSFRGNKPGLMNGLFAAADALMLHATSDAVKLSRNTRMLRAMDAAHTDAAELDRRYEELVGNAASALEELADFESRYIRPDPKDGEDELS